MTAFFSGNEDESSEQLNNYIHNLLGFHTQETQTEAWSSISHSDFQSSLQAIYTFQEHYPKNFIAGHWLSKIQTFLGSHMPGSSSNQPPTMIPPELVDLTESDAPTFASTLPSLVPPPVQGVPAWKHFAEVVPLWRRYAHSSGGSASTKAPRRTNRQSTAQLKVNDLNRAAAKLGGIHGVLELRETWNKMDTKYGGKEWPQSEGVVLGLITQGLSQKEIKAVVPCGGSKCSRLKLALDSNFVNFHTQLGPRAGSNGITENQLAFLKANATTWPTEDGFPCAHRRPRTYIIEEHVTWKLLHDRYKLLAETGQVRVLSLSRWRQLIQYHFPGLRLSRSKEDVCDACIRIETQLLCIDISDQLREKLLLEKRMHIQAAIDQRHVMSDFVKLFVTKLAPLQVLPDEILQECIDSGQNTLKKGGLVNVDLNSTPVPMVLIQAEDFGGSLALPHYGFSRPSADYYNSNLMIHQFVTANISDNTNKVCFYDERGQGKGADALCSLRMYNLLETLDGCKARGDEVPGYLVNILDNCVGQNKSNVVMKFFALVSVLFFQKVVLLYLVPGHSHMKADRVVAWCKGSIRGRNLYCPIELAKACDSVKGVTAEFLDHRNPKQPFFSKWETILDKYFNSMPLGFTGFYFYEFDEGVVSMRHLATSPKKQAICIPLIFPGTAGSLRTILFKELFGVCSVKDVTLESLNNLSLPRTSEISLTAKKIVSLSKKYFSITTQYLQYYPSSVGVECPIDEEAECDTPTSFQASPPSIGPSTMGFIGKKKRAPKDAVGARKPGRLKKTPPPLTNQPSIMTLFAPNRDME